MDCPMKAKCKAHFRRGKDRYTVRFSFDKLVHGRIELKIAASSANEAKSLASELWDEVYERSDITWDDENAEFSSEHVDILPLVEKANPGYGTVNR